MYYQINFNRVLNRKIKLKLIIRWDWVLPTGATLHWTSADKKVYIKNIIKPQTTPSLTTLSDTIITDMNSSSPFVVITNKMNSQQNASPLISNGKPVDLIDTDDLNSVKKAIQFKSPFKKNSEQRSSSAAIDDQSDTSMKGSSNKKKEESKFKCFCGSGIKDERSVTRHLKNQCRMFDLCTGI